jgi:medium-chain acyl-[acyl-carrier-protein] hydrolase
MLQTTLDICPVQLPGRPARLKEPALTRLQPLVQTVAEALLPYLETPFAFFGHSMGALISFELARHLRREYSLQPAHLFVSGHRAPQIPNTDPPTYNLPEAEFLEELRKANGTPQGVLEDRELMEVFLPILRADFEVCQTYTYEIEPPLGCPIFAFGGLQDKEETRDRLEAWREQTVSSFSIQMFPGDHFFLNAAKPLLLRTINEICTSTRH